MHVVVGGPYNSGLLAGGRHYEYAEPPQDTVAARDRLAALCDGYGIDLRAAALQFCAAHPVVCAVIPGVKDAARVRENVSLMHQPIPPKFWQDLKERGYLPQDAPTP